MWIIRVFSSATYLTAIVLSIPLAFDVGGKTCGLAYSLSLASFYFFYSVLKLATPDDSRFRRLAVILVGSTQWLIVPALLIWALNLFSVDSKNRNENSHRWIDAYNLKGSDASQAAWQDASAWTFGLMESLTIGSWDKLLRWSSPVFQLVEGFCSLLVIQAAGQITRWLVNRGGGGDTWMVGYSYSLVLALVWLLVLTDTHTDQSSGFICVYYLELGLLPMAGASVSGNIQRRCGSDRCCNYERRHFMWLGNWQRPW